MNNVIMNADNIIQSQTLNDVTKNHLWSNGIRVLVTIPEFNEQYMDKLIEMLNSIILDDNLIYFNDELYKRYIREFRLKTFWKRGFLIYIQSCSVKDYIYVFTSIFNKANLIGIDMVIDGKYNNDTYINPKLINQ